MTKNIELIDLCKTITEDRLEEFEKLVMEVDDLKAAFGDEIEELRKVFGNDIHKDRIACLENVLTNYMDRLSEETLAHLVKISFKDIAKVDSYEYTIMILDYALKNNVLSVQEAMAKAFVAAQEFYDPGHREWERNVYETLLDLLLKEFDERPLAYVLLNSDLGIFRNQDGDGAAGLFYDYFLKAADRDLALKVFARFKELTFMELLYDDEVRSDIFEKLEELKSTVVAKEIEDLAVLCRVLIDGFLEYDEEKTAEFLNVVCENIELAEQLDWYEVFEGATIKSIDFSYDLAFKAFTELLGGDSKGADFFYNLAYFLDRDRLKDDITGAPAGAAAFLEDVTRHYAFETDEDEFALYKDRLIGLINGLTEEEVVKAKEQEAKEKELKEAARLEETRLQGELVKAFNNAKADPGLCRFLHGLHGFSL